MDRSMHENNFLRQQIAIKQQRGMLVDIPESNFFNSFASPASSNNDTNFYQQQRNSKLISIL